MKMRKFIFLVGLLVAVVSVQAQVEVNGVPGKRPVAVTMSDAAGEVLKNDIRLSGWFYLGMPETAEFVVSGTAGNCTVTQRITQKVVLSKSYAGSDARRAAHKICDDMVQAITGERGIAQTKIAFILKRGKVSELAMMDYDGFNVRQLTSDGKLCAHPRWSPDGQKIIYTSYLNVFPDVIEANIATKQRRRIASFPGLNTGAEYSPDGGSIALVLSKDGNPELYTMNTGGGGLVRLTRTKGAESSPTWSPDGQQIAYVSDDRGNPQVYLINRGGGEPTRLTTPPGCPSYNTEPVWSRPPSGSKMSPMIALTSRVGGKFCVGVLDTAAREVKMKAADGADNQDPSWAPNGRHLVFGKTVNWRSRLYLLDVVTGVQVELPAVNGDMSEPAWGP